MSTHLDNLRARRDQISQTLANLNGSGVADDKANASGGPGVDHVGKIDALYRELDRLDELIARHEGPAEFVTYGDV